jgi:ABC-type transporter Mla maintaining outer membrane lipid asymmetry ATPase subunit MlaF
MHLGLVLQHAGLFDWLTVEENVAFPLVEHGHLGRHEIHERVRDVLERLALGDLGRRLPDQLSVGERKRVALARAIVVRPDLLIYDEPTTGQDPLRTSEIDDLIEEAYARFHITSLVISHDMTSTFRIADRIAMLHEGKVVAYGTPAELRRCPDEYVQHFLRAAAWPDRRSR